MGASRNFWLVRRAYWLERFAYGSDDYPDMAYARYPEEAFPTPAQKHPARQGSWDISHFYRDPVFLRVVYDNRKAIGVEFPQPYDLERVINQYL